MPLPTKTAEGVVIILCRVGLYDPHKFSMDDIIRFGAIVCDIVCLEDEEVTVAGFMLLNDSQGSTFSHMVAFTPTIAKKSAIFMQV